MMKLEFFGKLVPERDEAGRLCRVAEYDIPVQSQDGGRALIAEFSTPDETGVFVRVQSWDPFNNHDMMRTLMVASRVRVTVEVLD